MINSVLSAASTALRSGSLLQASLVINAPLNIYSIFSASLVGIISSIEKRKNTLVTNLVLTSSEPEIYAIRTEHRRLEVATGFLFSVGTLSFLAALSSSIALIASSTIFSGGIVAGVGALVLSGLVQAPLMFILDKVVESVSKNICDKVLGNTLPEGIPVPRIYSSSNNIRVSQDLGMSLN